jgi:hypothetical protein
VSIDINGAGFKDAWSIYLKDPPTHKWVYLEERTFPLNRERVAEIRTAIFPQAAHAALSAKLSDYDLMVKPYCTAPCCALLCCVALRWSGLGWAATRAPHPPDPGKVTLRCAVLPPPIWSSRCGCWQRLDLTRTGTAFHPACRASTTATTTLNA